MLAGISLINNCITLGSRFTRYQTHLLHQRGYAMSEVWKLNIAKIDDFNRPFVVEWLCDRSAFHSWFSSLVTGSFVVISVFGSKPGFSTPSGVMLTISIGLLVLSLLANLVCVWSIPSWKYRVNTGALKDATGMRRELSITAWVGVVAFISALTIGFIGNMPA